MYIVSHPSLKTTYLLKVYPAANKKSFSTEKRVLEKLTISQADGFPKLISSRSEIDRGSELLMELLGPNLRDVEETLPGKQFSLNQMYRIVIQLVERLKLLHSLHYVHGDLKL